jgi:hypothetical protein
MYLRILFRTAEKNIKLAHPKTQHLKVYLKMLTLQLVAQSNHKKKSQWRIEYAREHTPHAPSANILNGVYRAGNDLTQAGYPVLLSW